MIRIFLFLLIFSSFQFTMADEEYSFYSIDCNNQLSYFHMTNLSKMNISETIWPMGDWKEHEEALIKLEKQHGLYVFGAEYGRYSEKPITCKLGNVSINLNGNKISRKFGSGEDVFYRGTPFLTLLINNTSVFNGFAGFGNIGSITIDVGTSYVMLQRCLDAVKCEESTFYFDDYTSNNTEKIQSFTESDK